MGIKTPGTVYDNNMQCSFEPYDVISPLPVLSHPPILITASYTHLQRWTSQDILLYLQKNKPHAWSQHSQQSNHEKLVSTSSHMIPS